MSEQALRRIRRRVIQGLGRGLLVGFVVGTVALFGGNSNVKVAEAQDPRVVPQPGVVKPGETTPPPGATAKPKRYTPGTSHCLCDCSAGGKVRTLEWVKGPGGCGHNQKACTLKPENKSGTLRDCMDCTAGSNGVLQCRQAVSPLPGQPVPEKTLPR
jgi:hypothetical protein